MRGKLNIFLLLCCVKQKRKEDDFSLVEVEKSKGKGTEAGKAVVGTKEGRKEGRSLYTETNEEDREREREQAVDICKQRVDYDARAAANSTKPLPFPCGLYNTRKNLTGGQRNMTGTYFHFLFSFFFFFCVLVELLNALVHSRAKKCV
jgi:hypothetical protein